MHTSNLSPSANTPRQYPRCLVIEMTAGLPAEGYKWSLAGSWRSVRVRILVGSEMNFFLLLRLKGGICAARLGAGEHERMAAKYLQAQREHIRKQKAQTRRHRHNSGVLRKWPCTHTYIYMVHT